MYQRILVPVDGSDTSTHGVTEAIRLAKLTKGQLRFIHVVDELSFALSMDAYAGFAGDWISELRAAGAKLLKDALAAARKEDVEASTTLHDNFNGKLADLVAAEATRWPADLIVLGTHGRRGVGRFFLGSGAESILRIAPVPLLLIRAPESAAKADEPGTTAHVKLPTAALSIERAG